MCIQRKYPSCFVSNWEAEENDAEFIGTVEVGALNLNIQASISHGYVTKGIMGTALTDN